MKWVIFTVQMVLILLQMFCCNDRVEDPPRGVLWTVPKRCHKEEGGVLQDKQD